MVVVNFKSKRTKRYRQGRILLYSKDGGEGSVLDFIFFIISMTIIVSVIFKNKKILKQLSIAQRIGVGLSFLATVLIAFIGVYFGGNWIAAQFSSTIFKYIVFFIIVCLVIYPCKFMLGKVLNKITKGVLPDGWK